jgi:hypothetical protein
MRTVKRDARRCLVLLLCVNGKRVRCAVVGGNTVLRLQGWFMLMNLRESIMELDEMIQEKTTTCYIIIARLREASALLRDHQR